MQRKTFGADVKMAGDEGAGDLDENEFLVVISDSTLDRDGEIVDPGAFEPLPAKVNADIDHHMSVRNTVGSGRPYYEDDRLIVRGRFASTALGQETRTLVKEGHIDTTSIAFTKARREDDDDGVPHITSGELLNFAFVSIPANPNATVLAAKSAGEPLYTLDEAREVLAGDGGKSSLERDESSDNDDAGGDTAESGDQDDAGGDAGDESTGDAPDGAPDDVAADEAATRSAAARQRRSKVANMRAQLALATSTNESGDES